VHGFQVRLRTAKQRQSARGLALDERLKSHPDQGRLLLDASVFLRLGNQIVIKSYCCPHRCAFLRINYVTI
jgi:hypothetical protein